MELPVADVFRTTREKDRRRETSREGQKRICNHLILAVFGGFAYAPERIFCRFGIALCAAMAALQTPTPTI